MDATKSALVTRSRMWAAPRYDTVYNYRAITRAASAVYEHRLAMFRIVKQKVE